MGHECGPLHSNRSERAHVHEPQPPLGHVLPTGQGMPLEGSMHGPFPASPGGESGSVETSRASGRFPASLAPSGHRGTTVDAQPARNSASARAAIAGEFSAILEIGSVRRRSPIAPVHQHSGARANCSWRISPGSTNRRTLDARTAVVSSVGLAISKISSGSIGNPQRARTRRGGRRADRGRLNGLVVAL